MKLDQWIEIFRAGSYPGKRKFTAAEVSEIAARYDPEYHEAPVVVGHPEMDSPAFGWVDQLRAEGGRLFAKLKQVAPEFADAVEQGRYKKRSAKFYLDLDGRGLYLRHVGFLGGAPPMVKGLDPAFKEGDAAGGQVVEIEYEEEAVKTMTLEELKAAFAESLNAFGEKFGLKKAAGEKPEEAQFAEAIKRAKDELKSEYETKFAEASAQVDALKAEIAAQRKQADESGAVAFVESARTAGRLTPAQADIAGALVKAVAGRTETLEFGEGDAKQSGTAVELLEKLVGELPVQVDLGERTAQQSGGKKGKLVQFNEGGRFEAEDHELAERAAAIAAEKKIEYGEALKLARAAG